MQDRLKGLPDQALVNYVEQPMGEVPIYLALGELQRRKEMRERFQAIPSPETTTVSEKIVNEAKPKAMGIQAMAPQQMMPGAQGVGAPPEATQMDPRQLTASGVGSLPTKSMQLKEGGIIPGYATGSLLRRGYDAGKRFLFGGPGTRKVDPAYMDKYGAAGVVTENALVPTIEDLPATQNFLKRNPKTSIALGGIGAYNIFSDDEDKTKKPSVDPNSTIPTIPQPKEEKKMTKKELLEVAKERQKLINELIGEDDATKDIRTRAEQRRENALNMALIEGGLGMAAGQSDDFLQNLAAGATRGVQSFTETRDEVDEILADIDRQARTEDVAIATKAIDAQESALDRETELEKAKIASTGQTYGGYYGTKQMNIIRKQIESDPTYSRYKDAYLTLLGKKETEGLTADEEKNLNTYFQVMKQAENLIMQGYNASSPQSVGQAATTGGPYPPNQPIMVDF